jgi:hypothetical protein
LHSDRTWKGRADAKSMVATYHLVPRNETLRSEIASNDLPWFGKGGRGPLSHGHDGPNPDTYLATLRVWACACGGGGVSLISREGCSHRLFEPKFLTQGFGCHSGMVEDPIYMWGCKYLYQDRVFQPRDWPIYAELRDQSTKVTTQIPTFKNTSV